MRFRCSCGNLVTDTTDYIPYKGYVVSDTDFEDFFEAMERQARGQDLGILQDPFFYMQSFYQCEECGRLWFDDPKRSGHLVSFRPDDNDPPKVTRASEGADWKGFLRGFYLSKFSKEGHIVYHDYEGEHYEYFDNPEKLKDCFRERFESLKEQGRIESAWLNYEGETIFSWHLEDTLPKQEHLEIFLTEEESEALSAFKKKHAACHHNLPRGPKGWDFSYSVYPEVGDAADRNFEVCCLRCGETLVSKDKTISIQAATQQRQPIEADDPTPALIAHLEELASSEVRSEPLDPEGRRRGAASAAAYIKGMIDVLKTLNISSSFELIMRETLNAMARDSCGPNTANQVLSSPLTRRLSASAESAWLLLKESQNLDFAWVLSDCLKYLSTTISTSFPDVKPDTDSSAYRVNLCAIFHWSEIENDRNKEQEKLIEAIKRGSQLELEWDGNEDDPAPIFRNDLGTPLPLEPYQAGDDALISSLRSQQAVGKMIRLTVKEIIDSGAQTMEPDPSFRWRWVTVVATATVSRGQ